MSNSKKPQRSTFILRVWVTDEAITHGQISDTAQTQRLPFADAQTLWQALHTLTSTSSTHTNDPTRE